MAGIQGLSSGTISKIVQDCAALYEDDYETFSADVNGTRITLKDGLYVFACIEDETEGYTVAMSPKGMFFRNAADLYGDLMYHFLALDVLQALKLAVCE